MSLVIGEPPFNMSYREVSEKSRRKAKNKRVFMAHLLEPYLA